MNLWCTKEKMTEHAEHGFGKYMRLHRFLSKADFYISTESTAYAVYAPKSSNVSSFSIAT